MSPATEFLARHYNAMTGFPGRVEALAKLVEPWIREWDVKVALDAGCGGGALLFALRRLGVEAVGLDLSEPMLRLAVDNARSAGERFRFCGAPFGSAGQIFPGAFDACFVIGNALIGHTDNREIEESLRGLYDSLRPGGHILIQNLNTEPFFLGTKRVINRRAIADVRYLRFAVPLDDSRLMFSATAEGPGDSFDLTTSVWTRWSRDRLVTCVANSGLANIAVYGSIDRSPYDNRQSTDLVIVASRPPQ